MRFSGRAYEEGIRELEIDGNLINMFNIAKILADCFKYRNKTGIETAIEALRDILQYKKAPLMKFSIMPKYAE